MNKKLQYKILTMIVVFIGLLILMQCNAFASSLSISASKGSVAPGESFSVTVTVSGGSGRVDLSASNGTLSSSRLELLTKSSETVICTAGNSGTITITASGEIAESDGSSEEMKSASTSVSIVVPEKPDDNPSGNTGNQGGNTSNPNTNPGSNTGNNTPQPSNNANLDNLGVNAPKDPYDFTGFKNNITSYNTAVPNNVTSVKIYAKTEDPSATYDISGNYKNLNVGTNKITVTVTAPDKKTKKDYVIYIERKAASDEDVTPNVVDEEPNKEKEYKGLKSIILDDNMDLSPEFKTNIYSYKLKITGDLKTVPLKANAFDENAKVTITGNEDLVDGENLITIEVSFDDSDTKFVYKITVYKNVEEKEDTKDENQTTSVAGTNKDTKSKDEGMHAFTVAIILFVVVFIISGGITFLLIKERKPKSPWGDDEEDDDEVVEKSEELEEKAEFKKANMNEFKEDKYEEFSSPRGKGRH